MITSSRSEKQTAIHRIEEELAANFGEKGHPMPYSACELHVEVFSVTIRSAEIYNCLRKAGASTTVRMRHRRPRTLEPAK